MKAFILAAGKGSRLKPLTDHNPKCLLSIGGRPLLQYWLEACKLHGIQEVLINLHHHAEKVVKFIQSKNWPIKIRLSYETQLLGSGGTLVANKNFVERAPKQVIDQKYERKTKLESEQEKILLNLHMFD